MNAATVLVVSDEPFVESVVRHLLTDPEQGVARTATPAEVPSLVEQLSPRLLLVDVPSPDNEAARYLRDLHAITGLPLIVLASSPAALEGQLEPAVRVLSRPPNLADLGAALHAALAEPAEEPAPSPPSAGKRLVGLIGALVLAALAAILLLPSLGVPGIPNLIEAFLAKPESDSEPSPTPVHLIAGAKDTFELPADVVKQMGIPSPFQVKSEAEPRTLTLWGTLAFDPERLSRVQSRFPGEVVAVGTSEETVTSAAGKTVTDVPLHYGSPVRKDQVLAIVWSKDLGEKKHDLIDAMGQLKLDQDTLKRLKELYSTSGGTSEAAIRQMERNVSTGISAVNKAERTLKIWKVPDEEINAVKEEAKRVIARKGLREPEREKDWAKVEIRAAFDGVVVEKNIVKGHIVDSTQDLFKIADLSKLAVIANVYEEDLRSLHRLEERYAPGKIPWRVYLAADPNRQPLTTEGIKRIGLVVDPNQHTDLVMGVVDNPDRRLRVGQFVLAEVDIPAAPGVVSVPTSALDEDGETSYLLVQPDPKKPRYALRKVAVLDRFQKMAYVRSRLTPKEKAAGLSELRPGEWVVTGGAVQLKAALEEARARQKSGPPSDKEAAR